MKIALRIACGLLAGAVFYFSWLPQPQLAKQIPMPWLLSAWVDAAGYQNCRTAVPFLLWGLFAGAGLWQRKAPFKTWCIHGSIMIGTAVVAELGQLFIPARSCDPGDVGWATVGTLIGLGSVAAVGRISSLASARRTKSVANKLNDLDGAPKKTAEQMGE